MAAKNFSKTNFARYQNYAWEKFICGGQPLQSSAAVADSADSLNELPSDG